jgi:hypothetical protein
MKQSVKFMTMQRDEFILDVETEISLEVLIKLIEQTIGSPVRCLICNGKVLKDSCQSIFNAPYVVVHNIKKMLSATTYGAEAKCFICMENRISEIFVPCGHLVCCASCSNKVKKCPLCMVNISLTVNPARSEIAPLFAACRSCHSAPIDALNLPCQHINACYKCATHLGYKCIQCGCQPDSVIRVFQQTL